MVQAREQFKSKLGFVLAAAGSAVGIGNLVGFPVNVAQNGGAAFLIIYLAFVALVCLPVMMAEMSLGRNTQRNPLGAYNAASNKSRLWSIGGWLSIVTPFMIAVFYQVLTVWLFAYFVGVVSGNLKSMAQADYFTGFISSNGVFLYLVVLTIVVGGILNSGVQNGVERLAKVLMPALFVMLLALIIFVLTLPNAFLGVQYYLVPDFSKITPAVLNDALSQAFFSLSLGMGILITYGSYISKQSSIANGAKLVAAVDSMVAFFAGLLILPAIFVFNPSTDTANLSNSSISLVFEFLPKIFVSLEATIGSFGSNFFAAIFFLLVFFAALTSQISILQVPLSAFQDELKFNRLKSLLSIGALSVIFVLACTMSFGMVDWLSSFTHYAGESKSFFDVVYDIFYETVLPLNGFIVCMLVVFKWKKARLNQEMQEGDGQFLHSKTHRFLNVSISTYIPVILAFVFINTVSAKYFSFDIISALFK